MSPEEEKEIRDKLEELSAHIDVLGGEVKEVLSKVQEILDKE